jgi:hypothetical protein
MAGLIEQASAGAEEQAPQAPVENEQAAPGGGDFIEDGDSVGSAPASEEEQKQYDSLINPLLGLIHGETTAPSVLKILKGGRENLSETIGQLSVRMVLTLQQQVEKAGSDIEDSVLFEVGGRAVEELIEFAQAAGLVPEDDEAVIGKLFEESMYVALQAYGKATGEKLGASPEQARQKLDGMLGQADQEGPEANKLTTAIRQAMAGGNAPAQAMGGK